MAGRAGFVKLLPARQLMNVLREADQVADWGMPARCTEDAPHDINVYSDGSLKYPACHWWQLGGMGVYWPGRSALTDPLNQMESECAATEVSNDGVKLWGAVCVHKCSSTRTEVAAGIIAAMADRAIHLGTDSRSFQLKLQGILDGRPRPRKRPWT